MKLKSDLFANPQLDR